MGKYIANNLDGKVLGDLKLQVWTQIENGNFHRGHNNQSGYYNQKINFLSPSLRIENLDELEDYSKQHQIDFLVVDNIDDNHFPVFKEIFYNENDYPFLEKVYDTDLEGYEKLRVKIFEINHSKLE